ncbi:unnamed protein product [Didymodactylos carnosus]|uniref:protein geranylgeranyltransferase type II n=1 Tax=Didymodactylos carnosus TaxID=1234261 RepID=A0A815JAY8_9BILA|nr:unnamed protein product [Didymodactylos carnosus]CAF1376989.1 unnamed protein product [Didymodactylos carnosus]CAF3732544.1 unnamed protein product [Didymodactylos carnosus]CAF4267947.1 unnamed protein product [Didymodactylos carnosus]
MALPVLNGICQFIHPFLPFLNSHNVDYLTDDHWNVYLPQYIRDSLLSSKTEQIYDLYDNHSNASESEMPFNKQITTLESLFDIIIYWKKQIKQLTLTSSTYKQDLDNIKHLQNDEQRKKPPANLSRFMNEKKEHEVDRLVELIAHLASVTQSDVIVDYGSGKGYLDGELIQQYNLKVLALESQNQTVNSAEKRLILMNKKQHQHFDANNYKHTTVYIDNKTNIEELCSEYFPTSTSIIVTGLHACGSLSSTMLWHYIRNEKIKVLCNVACCYHLLEEKFDVNPFTKEYSDNDERSFPLCQKLIDNQFKLGRNARMLASQSIERNRNNKIRMGAPQRDITIDYSTSINELLTEKHLSFLSGYGRSHHKYEYGITDYLRMSGIYWVTTCLDLLHGLDQLDTDDIINFIKSCQKPSGAFSPSTQHDEHLLYTLSAVQILVILDRLDIIDKEKLCSYIKHLQQEDGSFAGDDWGEIDTRFSFCAVACLSLINCLNSDVINIEKATSFVVSCMNFDGGFGCMPGAESHSGQIYCCVAYLSIVHKLELIDTNQLGWWLCERQLESGGLNGKLKTPVYNDISSTVYFVIGRPEKLPDVCYSWWVLASLKIIGHSKWINHHKLKQFILAAQDDETGGFADQPKNVPDPFHTLFAVTGLSLINAYSESIIKQVNPVYCMPQYVIDRIGIQIQLL